MPIIGISLIGFGLLVIAMPELISYIIGGLLFLAGANILLAYFALVRRSNGPKNPGTFSFGGYEIHRKQK